MVIKHRVRRAKPVGWRNQPRRHALASKGIKTAVPKSEAMMKTPPKAYLSQSGSEWIVTSEDNETIASSPIGIEGGRKEAVEIARDMGYRVTE